MRCTRWHIISLGAALLSACAPATLDHNDSGIANASETGSVRARVSGTPSTVAFVDDFVGGDAELGHFEYFGHWQAVRGKFDGRSVGTSMRSTRFGDVAVFHFTGRRVRIYGVRGPSGGRAGIRLDGMRVNHGRPVDFYAPRIVPDALIYQSPVLRAGVHTVKIAVWGTRDPHGHFYYVNLDGADIQS